MKHIAQNEGGLRLFPTIALWAFVGLPLWWAAGAALRWCFQFVVGHVGLLSAHKADLETFGVFGFLPNIVALLVVVIPVLEAIDLRLWRHFPALRDPSL